MSEIDPTNRSLEEAARRVAEARDQARADARGAMSMILRELRTQMGDEDLQGLPNLASSSLPYYALPVRRVSEQRWSLVLGQKPMLVLIPDGSLRLVQAIEIAGHTAIQDEPVSTEDLMLEDLEHLAETVSDAIDRHISKCGTKWRRYHAVSQLADKIGKALDRTG